MDVTKRCNRCFSDRNPIPLGLIPGVLVCRGCNIEIDRVLGFLSFHGVGVMAPLFPPEHVVRELPPELRIAGHNVAEAPPIVGKGTSTRKGRKGPQIAT